MEDRKIKVAHIIPSLEIGGVEKGVMLSVDELNKLFDYTVVALTPSKFTTAVYLSKKILPGKKNYLHSVLNAVNILLAYKPDILICSLWKSVPVTLVYKIFRPGAVVVGFFHSAKTFHLADRFFFHLLLRTCSFIAVDSNATKQFVARFAKGKQLFRIPYIFQQEMKAVTGRGKGAIIQFVFAGRITSIKNIAASLKLLYLLKRHINFNFHIWGESDGDHKNELLELVTELNLDNEVTFKGPFSPAQTSDILSQYHFMLQLSKAEGMAMSVVEALMCGIIPVVTPVGEIPYYIRNLQNGIMVDDCSDDELNWAADRVLSIWRDEDLYNKIRKNCLSTFDAEEGYCVNMEHMLKKIYSDN